MWGNQRKTQETFFHVHVVVGGGVINEIWSRRKNNKYKYADNEKQVFRERDDKTENKNICKMNL